jgi:hypothetical protein
MQAVLVHLPRNQQLKVPSDEGSNRWRFYLK